MIINMSRRSCQTGKAGWRRRRQGSHHPADRYQRPVFPSLSRPQRCRTRRVDRVVPRMRQRVTRAGAKAVLSLYLLQHTSRPGSEWRTGLGTGKQMLPGPPAPPLAIFEMKASPKNTESRVLAAAELSRDCHLDNRAVHQFHVDQEPSLLPPV